MVKNQSETQFGPIILFGSGETLPASGKAYEFTANLLATKPQISVIETPAGFQPNSSIVAQKVAEFIKTRLQNYSPIINQIPAREREGQFSTNNQEILAPLLSSNWVFLGPGSPTYAVRQLRDSLLMKYLYGLHCTGAAITLSSAAVLAFSMLTLPVYEIYKVGEYLHWIDGLNFFKQFGQELIFVPHWNNTSGGDELDTNRCYMGQARFSDLLKLVPRSLPIIGIDEQTALIITFNSQPTWHIRGPGRIWITREEKEICLTEGDYDPEQYGFKFEAPLSPSTEVDQITQMILENRVVKDIKIPKFVTELAEERLSARKSEDWVLADNLRKDIIKEGWEISDTEHGYNLSPKQSSN